MQAYSAGRMGVAVFRRTAFGKAGLPMSAPKVLPLLVLMLLMSLCCDPRSGQHVLSRCAADRNSVIQHRRLMRGLRRAAKVLLACQSESSDSPDRAKHSAPLASQARCSGRRPGRSSGRERAALERIESTQIAMLGGAETMWTDVDADELGGCGARSGDDMQREVGSHRGRQRIR